MKYQANPAQLERWMVIYRDNLKKAVTTRPDLYTWPPENVPTVAEKMKAAFENGSFNHDGLAITWTCKELGFKATRKNIVAYLTNGPTITA
jgi:hypothetical protein